MTRTSPRHLWVTFALLSTSFHISRILAAYQAIPREHLITYIMEIISKSRTLACALACAEYAPISGICSMTDATRPYTAPDFLLSVNSCIQSACEGSDRDEALAYVRERCGAAELSSEYQPSLWSAAFISQLHRPRQVSTSTVVGTESFIPDQATSTRPSAAGSQITVTVSIPSASATRFATGTAVSVAHSGVKKSSAPLIVGVIIGVGAFIVSVLTVMYVLRRRRSQRSKIKGQRYLPSIAPQAGHNFDTGGAFGGRIQTENLLPPKTEGTDIHSAGRTWTAGRVEAGQEADGSMRQVAEIREEVEKLKQVLMDAKQPSGLYFSSADESTQLTEIREEMQRLRHFVSLRMGNRPDSFDEDKRSKPPPSYSSKE